MQKYRRTYNFLLYCGNDRVRREDEVTVLNQQVEAIISEVGIKKDED
jgi:hypothetical protein